MDINNRKQEVQWLLTSNNIESGIKRAMDFIKDFGNTKQTALSALSKKVETLGVDLAAQREQVAKASGDSSRLLKNWALIALQSSFISFGY